MTAYTTKGHYDLDAWKIARKLVKSIYLLTRAFPREEVFGLTAQMRRVAVSIPSNIAEGPARAGEKEFAHFLNIARGSVSELETQLIIASDLAYVEANDQVFELVDRVSRLITGPHKSVLDHARMPNDGS